MTGENRTIVSARDEGYPTIEFNYENGELFPYHLELGLDEYYITVGCSEKIDGKVLVSDLKGDRTAKIAGELNEEIGPFQLYEGTQLGIFITNQDISIKTRPDCVIEGNAKYVLCSGCIKVCGGPCPPGYYYKGPAGTCSYSLVLMCCCRVP